MRRLLFIALISTGLISACSSTEEKMEEATTDATQAVEGAEAKATETIEKAKESSSEDGSKVTCSNQKDSRSLEIRKTSSGGCELFYTKFDSEKSVASSGISMKYCEEVREKIKSNLARSGFTCK